MSKTDVFQRQEKAATQYVRTVSNGIKVTDQIARSTASLKREYGQLAPTLDKLTKQQREFLAAGRYSDLQRELKLTTTQYEALRKAAEAAAKAEKDRDKNSGKGGGSSSVGGSSIKSLVGKGAGLLTAAAGAFGAEEVIRRAADEWANYGRQLGKVSAITGLVGKDLRFLDEQAKKLEADTGIAGTEILQAFQNIGSIAPELLNNKELLAATTKEVIALSQASGLSLPAAAEAALGSLNQFGEGADQAGRFVNVLAAGAKEGASEVGDTAEALKNAGTSMKAAGLSFEQGNALIQVLAGSMIRGSEAGTGLRNVLLKLETDTDKNLRPSIVGLDKALENAAKKYDTTTELSKVFGTENINVARQVLGHRKEIEGLTAAITGTAVAYQQQKTITDDFAGDLEKATSGIGALFRSIGESQDGLLRDLTQKFTAFLRLLTDKVGLTRSIIVGATKVLTGDVLGGFEEVSSAAKARRQRETDEAAQAVRQRRQKDAVEEIKTATANQQKLYQEQGQTLVTAQRSAAAAVLTESTKRIDAIRDEADKLKAAYLKGDKVERAALKGQIDNVRQRALAGIAANNEAKAQVARLAKSDAAQRAALASSLGEKTSLTDEQKAAKSAADKAQRLRESSAKLLLKTQADYQKEIAQLEEAFGKDRLNALDKDSEAYIRRKAELDKAEIEVERKKLESLYQLAQSNQTRINAKTGEREVIPNKNAKLPADVSAKFDARITAVDAVATSDIERLRLAHQLRLLDITRQSDKLEVEQVKLKWDEVIKADLAGQAKQSQKARKAELERLKNKEVERVLLGQAISEIQQQTAAQIAFIDTARAEEGLRANAKEQGRLIIDLEKEKAKARLDITITEGQRLLKTLKEQGEKENALLIIQTEAGIDAAKKARKAIDAATIDAGSPSEFLGKLFGLTDESLQYFVESLSVIGNAITEITNNQIEESDRRIEAIQREIDAKKEQVDEEEQRAKEGYANNLDLRKQELADLKAQKAAEEQEKRKALKTKQELNAVELVATNALTVAELIYAAATQFANGIPLAGVALGIAAAATIYATISTLGAKARALASTSFEKGGEPLPGGLINPNGRSHARGGHKVEGTDLEFEYGEFIVNRKSTKRYRSAIEAINQGDGPAAALALIRELPLAHIPMPAGYDPARDRGNGPLQLLIEKQNEMLAEQNKAIKVLHNPKIVKVLPDGRVHVIDHLGNKHTYRP